MTENDLSSGITNEHGFDARTPEPAGGGGVIAGQHGNGLGICDPLPDDAHGDARIGIEGWLGLEVLRFIAHGSDYRPRHMGLVEWPVIGVSLIGWKFVGIRPRGLCLSSFGCGLRQYLYGIYIDWIIARKWVCG